MDRRLRFYWTTLANLIAITAFSSAVLAQLPAYSALPVRFDKAIHASRVSQGASVKAVLLQPVQLTDGETAPAGSILAGRVEQAARFTLDKQAYHKQQPSILSIHFDELLVGKKKVHVHLALRALADPFTTTQAQHPAFAVPGDPHQIAHLIDGPSFSPDQVAIRDYRNTIIATQKSDGIHAILLPAPDKSSAQPHSCLPSQTEQPTGGFAPSACGVYGFDRVLLEDDGTSGSGTFKLVSYVASVSIEAGSSALLQEIPN